MHRQTDRKTDRQFKQQRLIKSGCVLDIYETHLRNFGSAKFMNLSSFLVDNKCTDRQTDRQLKQQRLIKSGCILDIYETH